MSHATTLVNAAASALFLGLLFAAAPAQPSSHIPDKKICEHDRAVRSAEPVIQGGCIVVSPRKGNCIGCHAIAGVRSGNIAPPFNSMKQRFPDRARLRAQIVDARLANPNTVMPPFGAHKILTPEEIDSVVEFLLTL